ncbi:MAG: PfkB family carbohydrate kinase [Formosimonas sp.]
MTSSAPLLAAVIGGSNMDIVGVTNATLVHADSQTGKVTMSAGGVARNIAENLVRLGMKPTLCSVMGQDDHGRALWQHNESIGIDMSASAILPMARSSVYMTVHDVNGELAVAVNDMAIMDLLTPEFIVRQQHRLNQSSIWVLDTNLTPSSLSQIFNNHQTQRIFVDTVSATKALRVKAHLPHIHTIKPNRIEAAALTGLTCSSTHDIQLAAQTLLAQGVQQVVITLGDAGLYYASADEQGSLPAPTCPVVNTSGAGDALTAGLVYAHAHGGSLKDACQFAIGCATMTLGVAATNHPSLSSKAVHSLI